MAKFAMENLKAKKVAIMRDVKSDYSVGLADFFTQKYKELGGEVVADVSYQSNDVDFGMVGLFELTDPSPDDDTHRNVDRANRGEACLVFHTADVDAVYEGARAMGLTVLCPPTVLSIEQHDVSSKEMTLRDPNGVLCNFIQNLKSGSLGLSNDFPWVRKSAAPRSSKARAAAGAAKRKHAAKARP